MTFEEILFQNENIILILSAISFKYKTQLLSSIIFTSTVHLVQPMWYYIFDL